MSNSEDDRQKTERNNNIEWSSFKQFNGHFSLTIGWRREDIHGLVKKAYPSLIMPSVKLSACEEEGTCNSVKQSKHKQKICNLIYYLENRELEDCHDSNTSQNPLNGLDIHGNKCSIREPQIRTNSRQLWEKLLSTFKHKKSVNKNVTTWRRYLTLLPLKRIDQNSAYSWTALTDDANGSLISPLTSDASDSEESDICDSADPIYSKFGILRNGFHVSDDGMVFYSQQELEEYKSKMIEMRQVFQAELTFIKSQHRNRTIESKKSEERKLLSGKLDSQESDTAEDPDEDDTLTGKETKATKQERKSALFSSIQDAFSYAKTGIQGLFDKNSPNSSRKSRSPQDHESGESDDEQDTMKTNHPISTKNSEDLLDNHDEFTRQMTAEGGLKYQSGDKTVQQVSYQSLPPPLSLNTLQANNIDNS